MSIAAFKPSSGGVILSDVWEVPASVIDDYLRLHGLQSTSNPKLNRILVMRDMYTSNTLNVNVRHNVEHPNFASVMLQSNTDVTEALALLYQLILVKLSMLLYIFKNIYDGYTSSPGLRLYSIIEGAQIGIGPEISYSPPYREAYMNPPLHAPTDQENITLWNSVLPRILDIEAKAQPIVPSSLYEDTNIALLLTNLVTPRNVQGRINLRAFDLTKLPPKGRNYYIYAIWEMITMLPYNESLNEAFNEAQKKYAIKDVFAPTALPLTTDLDVIVGLGGGMGQGLKKLIDVYTGPPSKEIVIQRLIALP